MRAAGLLLALGAVLLAGVLGVYALVRPAEPPLRPVTRPSADLPARRVLYEDTTAVPPFPAGLNDGPLRGPHGSSTGGSLEFYAVGPDGAERTMAEHFALLVATVPDGAFCALHLRAEWTGAVSRAEVILCRRGDIPDALLREAVRPLRARWHRYGQVEPPSDWLVRFPPPPQIRRVFPERGAGPAFGPPPPPPPTP